MLSAAEAMNGCHEELSVPPPDALGSGVSAEGSATAEDADGGSSWKRSAGRYSGTAMRRSPRCTKPLPFSCASQYRLGMMIRASQNRLGFKICTVSLTPQHSVKDIATMIQHPHQLDSDKSHNGRGYERPEVNPEAASELHELGHPRDQPLPHIETFSPHMSLADTQAGTEE